MTTFTIKFRGKLTKNGTVKIPKITDSHLSLRGNEDTSTVLFFGGLHDADITKRRLSNMIGAKTGDYYWPSYASEEDGFTITPIGNGFMAEVTLDLDTSDMRRK